MSSGAFLFTAAPAKAEKACRLLKRGAITAAVIGKTTDQPGIVELVDGEERRFLSLFTRDEIIKLP